MRVGNVEDRPLGRAVDKRVFGGLLGANVSGGKSMNGCRRDLWIMSNAGKGKCTCTR